MTGTVNGNDIDNNLVDGQSDDGIRRRVFDLLNIAGVVGGATPWTPAEVDTYLGSSGANQNNVGTKATQPGTCTNCTAAVTP